MRTVYVDILIIVNLFIDLLLLLCTARLLHLRVKPLRLLLASLLGGAMSITALLPPLSPLLNIPLDILGAALLVLSAFGKTDIKSFMVRTAALFSASFSFCGAMLFICGVFRPKGVEVYNDVVYFNISPFVLIILTLLCYYTLRVIKRFTKGSVGRQVCTVTLRSGGSETVFQALADTGCAVKEPFSGEYVIIAERSCLNALHPAAQPARVIPFNSLGGSGILHGVKAEQILIDGKEISPDIYIGICENVLKGDIKAIVPYDILK